MLPTALTAKTVATGFVCGILGVSGAACAVLGYYTLKDVYADYKEVFRNLLKIRETKAEIAQEKASPELQQSIDIVKENRGLKQRLSMLTKENEKMQEILDLADKRDNSLSNRKKIEAFLQEVSKEKHSRSELLKERTTKQVGKISPEMERA